MYILYQYSSLLPLGYQYLEVVQMPRGETSQLGRHSGSLLVNSGSYPTRWRDLYFQDLLIFSTREVRTYLLRNYSKSND